MRFTKHIVPIAVALLAIVGLTILMSCDDRVGSISTYHITKMTVSPDTIYSDNNITQSTVQVWVKDNTQTAGVGQTVTFRTDLGSIASTAVTDTTGMARVMFKDDGDIGEATLTATIGKSTMKAFVTIQEPPAIDTLVVTVNSTVLRIDQTTTVNVAAYSPNGIVYDGTLVTFECSKGRFMASDGSDLGPTEIVQTNNGAASLRFNAGSQKGIAVITARIGNKASSKEIIINPGTGVNLELIPAQYSVPVNSPQIAVEARVRDRYMNPVLTGTTVTFTSVNANSTTNEPLGTITASASTDVNGIAIAQFSPGNASGIARITAVADSATANVAITVASDIPQSIRFEETPIVINVQGSGGQESAPIVVRLYDQSGNIIDTPQNVIFKFASMPPAGANLANVVTSINGSVTVPAVNGVAVVSINSGTESGTVSVKAEVEGTNVQSTKTNISINGGAPATIALSIGEYDSGSDFGGGVWRVEVGAEVLDEWGNPVLRGTMVNFEIDPSAGIPGETYEWVTINASGYINNTSVDGDSLPGVAYTYVLYDGTHSLDTVPIRASCGTVEHVQTLTLPMNQPSMNLWANPSHVDFGEDAPNGGTNPPICYINAELADNQGNPIEGAILTFSSTRGLFEPPDAEFQVPGLNYTAVTEPNNDNHMVWTRFDYSSPGHLVARATAKLRFHVQECPPPQVPPSEQSVDVTAVLVGTDQMDTITVTILRYN